MNTYALTICVSFAFLLILYSLFIASNTYVNSVKCHKCIYKESMTNVDIQKNVSAAEAQNRGFTSGYAGSGSSDTRPADYLDPSYNSDYYDSNNYNTQYHDDANKILDTYANTYGVPLGTVWVKDPNGKKVAILDRGISGGGFTYYDAGKYSRFGSGNYVPSYTDSVYLSNTFNFLPKSLYVA